MASIPLQRSKALLEADGWKVGIVERWIQRAFIRVDLFGLFDLVCIRSDRVGVMGIQCCGEDVQEHCRKYLEGYVDIKKGKTYYPNDCLPIWLKGGNTFFIWSWRLRKHEGTRQTYQLRQIEMIINKSNGQVEAHEIPDTSELKR